jgi:hypothetical protein
VGFLDKVKEKAAVALEQGKDVAQHQQLKMQLKKLEGEEEQALAAFGNAAFGLWEAGSLSMSSDLGEAASRIKDVRSQIAAKKSEIAEVGSDDEDDKPAEPATAGATSTASTASATSTTSTTTAPGAGDTPPAMPDL